MFMRYKNDSNCLKLLPDDGVTLSYVHAPFITGKGAEGWRRYSVIQALIDILKHKIYSIILQSTFNLSKIARCELVLHQLLIFQKHLNP